MGTETKLFAPDGGWGWVIMFSFVVIHMIIVPIQQNFGLLFKGEFDSMGMSGTKVASVLSTNVASSLLIGTCTGPLIKRFGIRIVAFGGSILFTLGLILLTFAGSYTELLIWYGLLTGAGEGILRLTSGLSLNLYFVKRRRKVAGVALALRSVGSIIFPHLIVMLLATYRTSGAALIIGGICAHTISATLLLHPVQWYMKRNPNGDIPMVALAESGTPLLDQISKEIKQAPKGIFHNITHYWDLTLFKNTVFMNIVLGMNFTVFSDVSFETLFSLILSDLKFDDHNIAIFVSTSYISNVAVRFVIPFVGDYFRRSSRFMYGLSCCITILGRFAIIFFANSHTIVTSVVWGIAHGMRTVYLTVLIADNVPAHQLSSAESIVIACNGILFLICGPFLGWIKDATGSFISCVYILNGFTSLTCILWLLEWIYRTPWKKLTVKKPNI